MSGDYDKKKPFHRIVRMDERAAALDFLYNVHQELGGDEIEPVEENLDHYEDIIDRVYDEESGFRWQEIENDLSEDERENLNEELDDVKDALHNNRELVYDQIIDQASDIETMKQNYSEITNLFLGLSYAVDTESYEEKCEEILDLVEELHNRIEARDDIDAEEVYSTLTSYDNRLIDIREELEGTQDNLEEVKNTADNAQRTANSAEETARAAVGKAENAEEISNRNAEELEELGENQQDMRQTIDEHEDRLEQQEERTSDVEDELEDALDDIVENSDEIEDTQEALSILEERVDEVEEGQVDLDGLENILDEFERRDRPSPGVQRIAERTPVSDGVREIAGEALVDDEQ